jgi:hypothetical protein
MPPFADRWVTGPFGVTPRVAEQLQELLEPGDKLRFVFEAETKRNIGRRLLYVLFKASLNTLGQIYVVITDRSVLLTDREELLLGGRVVYADLPLPLTLGPVSGRGWIVLDGKPIYVVGGRAVIERAEAALKSGLQA